MNLNLRFRFLTTGPDAKSFDMAMRVFWVMSKEGGTPRKYSSSTIQGYVGNPPAVVGTQVAAQCPYSTSVLYADGSMLATRKVGGVSWTIATNAMIRNRAQELWDRLVRSGKDSEAEAIVQALAKRKLKIKNRTPWMPTIAVTQEEVDARPLPELDRYPDPRAIREYQSIIAHREKLSLGLTKADMKGRRRVWGEFRNSGYLSKTIHDIWNLRDAKIKAGTNSETRKENLDLNSERAWVLQEIHNAETCLDPGRYREAITKAKGLLNEIRRFNERVQRG